MLLLKEKAEEMVRERVALRREQEELWGDNERLFGKLKRSKAAEVHATAKRRNLDARLVMVDAGQAVVRALKGGVSWLVALERELQEKAVWLSRQRRRQSLRTLRTQTWCCGARRGTRICGRRRQGRA